MVLVALEVAGASSSQQVFIIKVLLKGVENARKYLREGLDNKDEVEMAVEGLFIFIQVFLQARGTALNLACLWALCRLLVSPGARTLRT